MSEHNKFRKKGKNQQCGKIRIPIRKMEKDETKKESNVHPLFQSILDSFKIHNEVRL